MNRPAALIGFGAIAQAVCSTADKESLPLRQVLVRPGKRQAVNDRLPEGIEAIDTLDALLPEVGLVIECAGHHAVRAYGEASLSRGLDFALLSAGALADDDLLKTLQASALGGSARVRVLSGAIGGIDALAAAGSALTTVRYTARKPPLSWQGSPAELVCDLAHVTWPTPVFEGSARDAALGFEKNANVVATVALAAIGFDRTEVTLIADPDAKGNSHEIVASGGGYDLKFHTRGAALPSNPKTSALTAESVLRALRGQAPGLVV